MDNRLKKVLDHLEENLKQDFGLEAMADIACMSASRFHRMFRSEVGTTPFKFLEKLKMRKAYQWILQGNLLIAEIADELNYSDYETFSRAFKKHFGLSPDDMKSIVQSVRTASNAGEDGEIIVRAIGSEDEIDAAFKDVRDQLSEKGISLDEMTDSKVFRISHWSASEKGDPILIKNKFQMNEDKKIWRTLIAENGG